MTGYLSRSALSGVRVTEVRGGRAASVAGRMLAALGASVTQLRLPGAKPDSNDVAFDLDKRCLQLVAVDEVRSQLEQADVVLIAGDFIDLQSAALLPGDLHPAVPGAILGYATPFGLTGPRRGWRAGDLVTFHASGIARLLVGPVPEPGRFPPVRAAGDQSDVVAGTTLAAAVMLSLNGAESSGRVIDVSAQEALASIAVQELVHPAYDEPLTARTGEAATGNATVMLLPAADGLIAISPREPAQWDRWVELMGGPKWASGDELRHVSARQRRWSELQPRIAEWTRRHSTAELFRRAQEAHVPCFPLQAPGDLLQHAGLRERELFRGVNLEGRSVDVPDSPFGLLEASTDAVSTTPRRRPARRGGPLAGVRVIDFSWVIAGPTCTRLLAAMGADVIKVEAPGRGDPARASHLHAILGQGKRSIALDLKQPEDLDIARRLIATADVLVENFAAGVMERFGLGYGLLAELRPDLIYVSLSGMGQSSQDAGLVAYGTLVQAYSGFSALNGFPNRPPTIGWAWTDPVCALVMTAAVGAALRDRAQTGRGARIDISMIETMLWSMPGAIVQQQFKGEPPARAGNDDPAMFPHGVYRATGDDRWLAIAIRDQEEWRSLCRTIPGLGTMVELDGRGRRAQATLIERAISAWASPLADSEAAAILQEHGVPAAASADARDLFADKHLRARGFFAATDDEGRRVELPAVPWLLDGERGASLPPASALDADRAAVLAELRAASAQ